jgi:hypothetical protein
MILLPKEPIARPPYIIYRGNDPESRQFPLLKTGESVFSFFLCIFLNSCLRGGFIHCGTSVLLAKVRVCVLIISWCRNQCCGSGMFIPDPDFYPSRISDPGSRIPDPKTATKKRGEQIFCQPFFCSHKFHKIVNYFIFEMLKKKLGQFSKNYRTSYSKNCHQALKNMGLGPEIRDPEKKTIRIPDPGVKKAPDPHHWVFLMFFFYLLSLSRLYSFWHIRAPSKGPRPCVNNILMSQLELIQLKYALSVLMLYN